ncbi:ABC transporter ATP-binding protein [Salicibibacter kimchii]|nr:ABC transporter ATP-binding protein [Salicibibacter kimchii]
MREVEQVLETDHMKTSFHTEEGSVEVINDISLSVSEGETLAIVGESGSGKSVSALSILRLLDNKGKVTGGNIWFNGQNLTDINKEEMRNIRGRDISMIFQDPMTSLDPVYTIGDQIIEAIQIHENLGKEEYYKRALELLRLVGLPDAKNRMNSFPHQLSGGQRQRVMIAIALSCRPKLLIADEPTTALDVTVQAQIMKLLKQLQMELGTSILLVTHDLGVVAEMADRVAVIYAGQVVEQTDVKTLFFSPSHPYTEALLKSIPRLEGDLKQKLEPIKGSIPNLTDLPSGCRFHPRCPYVSEKCEQEEPPTFLAGSNQRSKCWLNDPSFSDQVAASELNQETNDQVVNQIDIIPPNKKERLLNIRNVKKHYPIKQGIFARAKGNIRAVDSISFDIYRGETLGLVGESGCGKSTLGRLIAGLINLTDGKVTFDGYDLSAVDPKTMKKLRKRMQFVFQDPYSSLNPRMRIFDIIAEPLEVHDIAKGQSKTKRIIELLELVGLSQKQIQKYPHQLSGGQKQRIVIARALATDPDLVICDEAVSSLDVSVQAQILNLLKELQEKMNLSFLFISHDLSVVKYIANRISVMYLGEIVEIAETQELFHQPLHPYTKALISAAPVLNPLNKPERIELKGDVPSPSNPPSGCPFHTRCPEVMDICRREKPELREINGRKVSCHLH